RKHPSPVLLPLQARSSKLKLMLRSETLHVPRLQNSLRSFCPGWSSEPWTSLLHTAHAGEAATPPMNSAVAATARAQLRNPLRRRDSPLPPNGSVCISPLPQLRVFCLRAIGSRCTRSRQAHTHAL